VGLLCLHAISSIIRTSQWCASNGQAGTWFTYPGGMEGWVDLGDLLHTERVTCPQTVTHPSTNEAQCRLTTVDRSQLQYIKGKADHAPLWSIGGLLISLSETTKVCDAWPVWRQTYGYLPGRRASPSFGRYQIVLLGDRGTMAHGC